MSFAPPPSTRRSQEFPEGTPTAEAAARAVGCRLDQIVKSLVFVCDGAYVLALVPGDRRADEERVAAAAERRGRSRGARRPRLLAATGFEPGAVAPFPLRAVDEVLHRADAPPARPGLDRRGLRRRTWRALAPGELQRLTGAQDGGSRRPSLEFDDRRIKGDPMQATEKIWMNGELVDWDDARIHVGAHGLHYGTGVFEGIRCYDTPKGPAVFRLTDHMQRLHDSARLIDMELPYSVEDLRGATNDLLGANGLARVLHPPDRLLRLRPARRLGARQPGRDGDHVVAVGHLPRRGGARDGHPHEDLDAGSASRRTSSRMRRRRRAST